MTRNGRIAADDDVTKDRRVEALMMSSSDSIFLACRRLNLIVADAAADGPAVWNARVAAGKSSSNTRAVLIMVALLWKSGIIVSVACCEIL